MKFPLVSLYRRSLSIAREGGNYFLAGKDTHNVYSPNLSTLLEVKTIYSVDVSELTSIPLRIGGALIEFEGEIPETLDLSQVVYMPDTGEAEAFFKKAHDIRAKDGLDAFISFTAPVYEQWDGETRKACEEIEAAWPTLRKLMVETLG